MMEYLCSCYNYLLSEEYYGNLEELPLSIMSEHDMGEGKAGQISYSVYWMC